MPLPPDPPLSRRRPTRPPVAAVVAVVVLMLIGGGIVLRSSGGGLRKPATTTTIAPQPVRFAVSGLEPHGTAPPTPETVAAVVTQLDAWATFGIVEPLRAGGDTGPSVDSLFTTSAYPAAFGGERPTILLVGIPQSAVAIEHATASLSSVAGPDEVPAVVVATVDLRLRATAKGHRVTIVRQGDVVFVPQPDGSWRIDGWRLHATEDSTP
ncbi:MAG: hypothetical protein ACR2H3_14900 [Acidimicrobiales bacterium]